MAPQSWPSQLSETAFTVTGLKVGEVDYDALPEAQPLKNLLSVGNALDYFEISGNPSPDPILPWLKTGSHNLTSLLLRDMPEDGQLLIDVLGAKPKLSALTLDNGSFAAGGLTLAQVLQAAPGLKSLSLTAVFFQVGGSVDCLQALRDSHLREIQFSVCLLNADGAGEGLAELRETHQELLQGLREAPHLEVLKVTELDHGDRDQLALMLAGEFVLNPAAKTLCILDAGAESRFQELVVRANAQRAHQKLPPLELKTEATPAFEEEVDSDLMVELLRQFRSTGPLGPDGDDMGLDDLQDDEMNDDAPDDRRDDPNN
jgi:hypothetical protein